MANRSRPTSPPGSPTDSSKSPVRSRRKSGSKVDGKMEAIELRSPASAASRNQGSQHVSDGPLGEANLPRTPVRADNSGQIGSSSGVPSRRHPRQHGHEREEGIADALEDDAIPTLHDIRQSRWIEDPNNHAAEKIYLTVEDAPLSQMSTIDTSFCWVHQQRGRDMQFEDFVVSSESAVIPRVDLVSKVGCLIEQRR